MKYKIDPHFVEIDEGDSLERLMIDLECQFYAKYMDIKIGGWKGDDTDLNSFYNCLIEYWKDQMYDGTSSFDESELYIYRIICDEETMKGNYYLD